MSKPTDAINAGPVPIPKDMSISLWLHPFGDEFANPFEEIARPPMGDSLPLAHELWSKYHAWCQSFAKAMLTVVKDAEGNVIPTDQCDLDTIQRHDRYLYDCMRKCAERLGIPDAIMESCKP